MHGEQAMQRRVREESEHNHPVKRARVAGEIGGQSLKVSTIKNSDYKLKTHLFKNLYRKIWDLLFLFFVQAEIV